MKLGLFARLWWGITLLFLGALLVMGTILLGDARKRFEDQHLSQAKSMARTLAEGSLDALITGDYELLERWVAAAKPSPTGAYAALVRPNGQVLTHTDLAQVGRFASTPKNVQDVTVKQLQYENRSVMEIVYPAVVGDRHLANAHVAYYLDVGGLLSEDAALRIGSILLLSLLILTVGTFLVIRRLIRPVKSLTESVSSVSLEQPIRIERPILSRNDEVGSLARAFDVMSARLMASYEAIRRDEQVLIAEKEWLAVTLRSIGDGVITTDTEGKVLLINKTAEELTGWNQVEAVGRPLAEVFHIIEEKTREICVNPVEKTLNVNESGGMVALGRQAVLIARDGTERPITETGAPIYDKDGNIIGVVSVFRDITERRRMEEERLKAQKLESLGVLAGGIAHDFNNILTGILGYVSIAKMHVTAGDEMSRVLTHVEKASLRARDLTQQLLTFSRGGAPTKKTVSIADLIKESTAFALRGSNVRCEFAFPDDLWPVEADEGQMSQVIHNLVINADQAMPEGGVIQVRAENVSVAPEHGLPLKHGEYVKGSIQDHGIGIPHDHLSRIFDPYFTTKQEGSGLGLATAYSIVQRHDGTIDAESEVGVGTTFHFYLPASQKQIRDQKVAEERHYAGKGKILIMDDEEVVRDVAGEMLKHLGYTVKVARDGAEAIERYREAKASREPFSAVVMDLTIPGGMGGKEAIHRLLEMDPNVIVIVSSGYSNDPIMADFREYGFCGVVAKPYKIEDLSRALHKALMEKNR